MFDSELTTIAVIIGGGVVTLWVLQTALTNGLQRIADRIDNQSRISEEIRKELSEIRHQAKVMNGWRSTDDG